MVGPLKFMGLGSKSIRRLIVGIVVIVASTPTTLKPPGNLRVHSEHYGYALREPDFIMSREKKK